MNTLLIFPRFRYPSGDPPLGIAYLASALRRRGLSVDIMDCTFMSQPLDELRTRLQQKRYDLVGMTVLTSMLEPAVQLAGVVRAVSPETTIIAGGPHATVAPRETLALGVFDAVMAGEGEEALPALVENGLQLDDQPGLWWLSDRDVVEPKRPAPVTDLDSLDNPAWDLLDMRRYLQAWYHLDAVQHGLPGTSVMASRGCPYRCSYCQPTLDTLFGRQVRRRSPESLMCEITELKERYGVEGLMWLDDTFLLDRGWMRALCEAMIADGPDVVWGCNLRADLTDHASLAMMKEAGLRMVHIGIESGAQRVIDEVYDKGITLEHVREAVATAKDLDLKVRGYFILGAPTETEEEVAATMKLASSLRLDDVTFSIATPLPHTYLYEKSRHLIRADFSEFDYYKKSVYNGEDVISDGRLNWLRRLAYVRFYLGPARLLRTIRSVVGISGVRKAWLKILRF